MGKGNVKIILYALGKLYRHYKDDVCWDNVIAVSDSNPLALKGDYPVPAIELKDIASLQYDYIAVFSNRFFDEIRFELIGKYCIKKEKIISWRAILRNEVHLHDAFAVPIYQFVRSIVAADEVTSILDLEMNLLPRCISSKDALGGNRLQRLDGIRRQEKFFPALYDNIYKSMDEIDFDYHLMLLDDINKYTDEEMERICKHGERLLLFSCLAAYEMDKIRTVEVRLAQYGRVRCIVKGIGMFWLVETRCVARKEDISIYVVMHKPYGVPSFYPYRPLCVGGYKHNEYLSETVGDNIASLNYKINECTALYWMWKNSSSRYVGLNHYRRYFYNNSIQSPDNILDAEHANDILRTYDIILPQSEPWQCAVGNDIFQSIEADAFYQGADILKRCLAKVFPGYVQTFDLIMQRYNFYMCNMFVTHTDILHEYCSWLFSFLIDAAEEFDASQYDDYSKRAIGFFAERMLTVWLYDKKLKIKELPFYNAKF